MTSTTATSKSRSSTNGGGGNLPWVEKYRPSSLNDLVSHKHIISTIEKFVEVGEDGEKDAQKLPHLLLYGPPGTGKTSTIKALATQLYGKNYRNMVLELNASDDRGINVVREQIKTFASTRTMFNTNSFKLIVLDEADALTRDAQAALRRVIEKYTRHTRFCLICNYVSKISPALQSRCTRFRFAPLAPEHMVGQVMKVVEAEKINSTEAGVHALIRLAKGDMRKALNILQSTHMAFDNVDEDSVYICTGTPLPSEIRRIVHTLLNTSFKEAFNAINTTKTQNGFALEDIVSNIHEFMFSVDLPVTSRLLLLDHLATIEARLSTGASEDAQLASLVGVFQLVKEQAREAAE
eukprot:m.138622 g.138622  ORF g.138622 m.138622 type:complete len:351 (-) comp15768_c0_seq1:197-1249(-)